VIDSRRNLGLLACALAGALALVGCAPTLPTTLAPSSASLLAEARAEGLDLQDPLAIDSEMASAIEKTAATLGTPEQRLRYLVRYLGDAGYVNFQYQEGRSLTAREAFRERRGDCMAYTNLFMALARHLGIDAYFVHVSQVKNYYERSGWFFVSSHVAVGAGKGPGALIVDFSWEISDWQLSLYESIDDGAALSLYYNNVAVDHMVAGRMREAERLFRFWLAREPGLPELHNNLGVLLNREGRHAEALALLQRGMERFPSYKPLFTNGIGAARGARHPELAADFERRGQLLEQHDPFFLFARGVGLYQDDRFLLAARALEQARDAKPDSPVILAWLTRAYLSAGKRAEGIAAFQRAKALGPSERVLRDLEQQFPELRAPSPN
jgi:tetratricopeptide (TPR) repeat protein